MAATAGPAQHAHSIILAPNRILLSSVGEGLFFTAGHFMNWGWVPVGKADYVNETPPVTGWFTPGRKRYPHGKAI
jgi:hypothetical protein